jgi:hypothetical protein
LNAKPRRWKVVEWKDDPGKRTRLLSVQSKR